MAASYLLQWFSDSETLGQTHSTTFEGYGFLEGRVCDVGVGIILEYPKGMHVQFRIYTQPLRFW